MSDTETNDIMMKFASHLKNISGITYLSPQDLYGSVPPIDFNNYLKSFTITNETKKKIEDLHREVEEKNRKLKEIENALKSSTEKNEELEREYQQLKDETARKERVLYLLQRIFPNTLSVLNSDDAILSNFFGNETVEMAVMSIDIRKSTELMLKASSPDYFAKFISELTESLRLLVVNHFGVFDKFTGDGILAYFPLFYSGENALLNCCLAAQKSHDLFDKHYRKNRNNFDAVLDTGLGIGIDIGEAKIITINDEPTIVGTPVVYACRLSDAPSGHTYLNIHAHSKAAILGICSTEVKFEIKEGKIKVYDLEKIDELDIDVPQWATNIFNQKTAHNGGG